ncbi:AbrB/MazE/SpoVT family DNA-binding domain-containing protein [Limnohabitans sp. DM1]|uniref:AbrB/MazE/SpoVT family DNA-binding domain-containing protein n=1 Tax=Limnohabitans sp. DM1 TaxID=1597955 RepID=UPI000B29912F|nr:AbrB/MazE/SpoVT family DNA-binding domain-containing protein [Limnohabitans sp. DM1]
MLSTLTSKGQVTIPQALRQQLGLMPGQAVTFDLSADASFITLRPAVPAKKSPQPGFGMVKVKGPHVAADWDAAQALKP